MAERGGLLRRPLARADLYSLVQRALGADAVRRTFVARHLCPRPGERVLDLGCGPGDILDHLPAVDYLGVDISERYVEAARARRGNGARFIRADVRGLELDPESFDAVIAIGMLHHLDDREAEAMIALAASALRPNGRLVTLDPGRVEDQARVARWMIERDRGLHVRSPDGYRRLAEAHLERVRTSVHHDLARVPFTHVVVEARRPAVAG